MRKNYYARHTVQSFTQEAEHASFTYFLFVLAEKLQIFSCKYYSGLVEVKCKHNMSPTGLWTSIMAVAILFFGARSGRI